ncbi:acetyl-CoA carboxylase biotin carboxyl carrier protein [Algimonas porphyrae]|uniref:Biotin carboxyl carrier protein of acetyl-CoA carboxylase n=1 Tax=Algimonas porphyrae TaxID=1128113 RepID=A0ABQ5UYU3_9PROT|nr:acetyl-CoA carboxylase biotin carboxyl carrier protein [Algimonas porphyrae]GLQ20308.1 acetyl-CoA carboxylase biotin carboxyl carrier protein subunit [Algimonas porphyrae]
MAASKGNNDLELIKELAKVLDQTDLTEIEMKKGDLKIRVSKNGSPSAAPQMIAASAPAPVAAAAPAQAPSAPAPMPAVESKDGHPDAVTSPMVGTCYLRPSPDADAFAEIGAQVKEGDTIMLVEAMKTFNPITAPKSGKLSAVYVEDVSPVEFGDSLFLIE